MPTVTCICNECGKHFYTRDTYVPVGRNNIRNLRNKEILTPKTWEEWVLHCITFCEDCRLKSIPTKCLEDAQNQDIKG